MTAQPDLLDLLLPEGQIPLRFVQEPTEIFLVASDPLAVWPVDVLRSGTARVRVSGSTLEGAATLLSAPKDRARVLALFRSKYGEAAHRAWFGRPDRVLRIDLVATQGQEDPSQDPYRRWLIAEFDGLASIYDEQISNNRINRLLRERSSRLLAESFRLPCHLLEIGCGTGMETIPLLEMGHEVLCVDISERMLEIVRAKASALGVGERLRTRKLAASDLSALEAEHGLGAFEGGYSTYGALNCEPDLRPISPALGALLRPRARFLAGVLNRWCLFEMMADAVSGRFREMRGRARGSVRAGSSRFRVDAYAYSPNEFLRCFAGEFTVEWLEGVPVLLPPPDRAKYVEPLSRHFDLLARWDEKIGRRGPFRSLGDYFLMVLARRDAPPPHWAL
jgi:SAM-dependent methyltransferase